MILWFIHIFLPYIIIKLIYFFIIMSQSTNNTKSLLNRLTDIVPDNIRDTFSNTISTKIPDKLTPLTALPYGLEPSHTSSWSLSWQSWVVIVLILTLLGINIFAYLAKGAQDITTTFYKIFGPIIKLFTSTVKQTVQTSASGVKSGVDVVEDTVKTSVDVVENTVTANQQPPGKSATTTLPVQQTVAKISAQQQDALQNALEDASKHPEEVNPDEPTSSLQGKGGWCYIGEDNGNRTCSQIGKNDTCMSGDIFPSQDICVNPNLRA